MPMTEKEKRAFSKGWGKRKPVPSFEINKITLIWSVVVIIFLLALISYK